MKKTLTTLLLTGIGLLASGCQTPGGAIFMSALGAASMAKGGTPNQMALAGAYKSIGDSSLAMQNSKRQAEAGQEIARAIESNGQFIEQNTRRKGEFDDINPVLDEEFYSVGFYKDLNNNGIIDNGEFVINQKRFFSKKSLIKNNETLAVIAGFGIISEGKIVTQNLRNNRGDVVMQTKDFLRSKIKDNNSLSCCETLTKIDPSIFNKEGLGNNQEYTMSYNINDSEVYVQKFIVNFSE